MISSRYRVLVLLTFSFSAKAWDAPPPFQTCTDYHCDILQPVALESSHWREIRALFPPQRTAKDERGQISKAIAQLEQIVGKINGTWRDLAENDGEGSEPGQLDCIAESLNTTTYLQLMEQDNLLKWHRVEARQRRNPWLFDVHWTATILDREAQQIYAVDSWFFENGHPPIIQPIEAWLSGQAFIKN
ncbi:hypothetical protein [Sedimenticola selenatireducens]|uniref:DUF1311 domain-containing protein n=1 Tax=Sedimenticola selenatireducens TaxID=191960 RepID=A0A557S846_9GAMM|nr:hypothetical protein [Sedimenticola selenatireducens]TVO73554.1 hypothetical protein FHP88_11805 [Sedimenticola selenatireducens]TVT63495.1 MAG: hypothetical protein FHK78_11735 [Sedimenticola selenatireducens]